MKHSILFLLFYCLIIQSAFSQTQLKNDSLLQVLNNAKADTIKVKTLNELAAIYARSNADSCMHYAGKALSLSKQINWKPGTANSLYLLSSAHKVLGQLDSALIFLEQSYAVYAEIKDSSNLSRIIIYTGLIYNTKSEYDVAFDYYHRGLKIAESINDSACISRAVLNLGLAYYHQKDYEAAIKNYKQGLAIQEKLQDKSSIAAFMINCALIYSRQNMPDTALVYYQGALKNFKETGNKINTALTLNNIGTLYIDMLNYPEGLRYQWESLAMSEGIKDKGGIGRAYNNLGETYRLIAGDTVHTNLPDSLRNRKKLLQSAIVSLQKAIEIKKQMQTLNDLQNAYAVISQVYSQVGDYKSAYENLLENNILKDSVFNLESKAKIATLEAKRETEAKEKEIQIQKLQIQAQQKMKWVYLSGIILLLFLSLIFVYRYRLKQAIKFEKLRTGIASDLHDDIGSTLSSISLSTTIIQKNLNGHQPGISNMLNNMSRTSMEMMDSMSDIVWAINVKNDRFDNVIHRMRAFTSQMLEPSGASIHFNTSPGIEDLKMDMAGRKNLYLIYKEAINNAAKYSGCKNVWIDLSHVGNKKLVLKIKDDGKGFEQAAPGSNGQKMKMGGNGLTNMHKRAAELKGQLQINTQEGKGTEAILEFSL